MAWPPTLEDLKEELDIPADDSRDNARLTRYLAASVAFVERVRRRSFNFAADPESTLPAPTADVELGTLRLASRWNTRRRSPDALVQMGDLGASRVSSGDPDIDRMLRIGKHARPVVA